MAILYGNFKDIDDTTITVLIMNPNHSGPNITIGLQDDDDDVYFASDPIQIEMSCDNSFTHVIKQQATISVITRIYLGDYIYANNAQSVIVNIFKDSDCIFCGYIVPNTYNQGYANVYEQLDIQCIDYLSSLQYKYLNDGVDYEDYSLQAGYSSFKDYINKALSQLDDCVIRNYPYESLLNIIWVETGFTRSADSTSDTGYKYYAIETKCFEIDSTAAMKTTTTRRGDLKTVTYVQGEITDFVMDGTEQHYKEYAYIDINGVSTNTGDYRIGQQLPNPTVVSVTWEDAGVIRNAPNQYFKYQIGTATLSDGSVIPGYDNRVISNPLPYFLVKDTLENTITSGGVEYYRYIPVVTQGGKRYPFPEDAEIWTRKGQYDVEIEHRSNSFTLDPGVGTVTSLGETIDGTYAYGIALTDYVILDELFESVNVIKIASVPNLDPLELYQFCHNAMILKYVRFDILNAPSVTTEMFNNCISLEKIIFNCPSVVTLGTDALKDVLPQCAIYVPRILIPQYRQTSGYGKFSVLALEDLNITPLTN